MKKAYFEAQIIKPKGKHRVLNLEFQLNGQAQIDKLMEKVEELYGRYDDTGDENVCSCCSEDYVDHATVSFGFTHFEEDFDKFWCTIVVKPEEIEAMVQEIDALRALLNDAPKLKLLTTDT